MAGFHWGNAFEAFRDLEREMDRLLSNVERTFEGVRFGRPYPHINIYDLGEEYLLTAELPGMTADDLELSVAGGILNMRGHRKSEDGVAQERYRRSERPQADWERSIGLPDRVREEDMHAEMKHGILKLHLPKAPASQVRQIPVTDF